MTNEAQLHVEAVTQAFNGFGYSNVHSNNFQVRTLAQVDYSDPAEYPGGNFGGMVYLHSSTSMEVKAFVGSLFLRADGTINFSPSNAQVVSFQNSGAYAFKTGGGVWGTYSDSRLKTNVREIGSALEKIDALHPVHFEFINAGESANPTGTRTGFIAQEFEQVLPGHTFEMEPMVDADKELLGQGVKAKGIEADLVPYLVKAIQELKAELDSVKTQLAALQGQV
jgi:hypothetical protein